MLRLVEHLWATTPAIDAPLSQRDTIPECAPPVPFTESDNDPTEEVSPPTLKSPLDAESAFQLANRATDEGRYEDAKAYLRYANMYSSGKCFVAQKAKG